MAGDTRERNSCPYSVIIQLLRFVPIAKQERRLRDAAYVVHSQQKSKAPCNFLHVKKVAWCFQLWIMLIQLYSTSSAIKTKSSHCKYVGNICNFSIIAIRFSFCFLIPKADLFIVSDIFLLSFCRKKIILPIPAIVLKILTDFKSSYGIIEQDFAFPIPILTAINLELVNPR